MLSKEAIISVFKEKNVRLDLHGYPVMAITERLYSDVAEQILLLVQPPSDNLPPQLQQHAVSGRSEQLKAFLLWYDKDLEMGDSADAIVKSYVESL